MPEQKKINEPLAKQIPTVHSRKEMKQMGRHVESGRFEKIGVSALPSKAMVREKHEQQPLQKKKKEGKGRFDGIQAHDMSRLIDHRLSQKRVVFK